MDVEVDHYSVLGLPTGEEGAKLSEKEISKAYRAKALELHPDKRPDDLNAHANFQKLKSSYEILKDDKARKLFDDLLRVKADQQRRQLQKDAKRRRMVSDLEERERAAFETDPAVKAELEERRILKKLKEEIDRIREMHSKKAASTASPNVQTTGNKETPKTDAGEVAVDTERTLKVSWEKLGPDYAAERLRTLFSVFGGVEDVVTRKTKKRGSALVVMSSKEAATAALGNVIGDLSNPLLVVPLESGNAREPPSVNNTISKERLNTLVGAGYQDYEDSVMRKLQQAAARQK
ncbi:hypothetical protein MLD38_013509 [Melastoma candidum]|uniref:Uncharacterized protein n=1 Tax=Melastoma candidum TaxID=119954 RepID=A0ACB9RB33_9MYRT|nr:hypothetical protein MLD38_013509 [Melastoma candidum]